MSDHDRSAGGTSIDTVRVEIDDVVARVTIDRPSAQNALSPPVIDGLNAAVDAALDRRCAVFVLRGAGGSLSAGADLPFLQSLLGDPVAVDSYVASIGAVLDRIETAPFVSVAVVGGYALAGGCEILLACDLGVVAHGAKIGDRHLEYGLLPGAGGSVRLPRAVPGPVARRLLYTGEIVDGATAAAWGLVSHVAPDAELETTVDTLVARLSRHSPEALAGMKRLYRQATAEPGIPIDEALGAERAVLVGHVTGSAAAAEGLAAFRERRPPRFRGPGGDGATGRQAQR